ncbi:MAG: Gfo/Idh/MocA family oxidoreductase [Candidatus Omnitrophica bacterium]|nr:Gfo/Idh/MocA family oxidoreductase [Candidatus Omnitrophota bacterium]
MNRREFIRSTAAGALAAAYSHRVAANSSPNNRIQLGAIGLGGMGRGDLSDFLAHDDVEVAALCDVDRAHLEQASAMVKEKRNRQPDLHHDFRELLSREDIDAVLIATPDHWHGPITILACQNGKDVYVEKPLTHNVREGRLAVEAALANGRITQLGTQVHATPNYHKAVEVVQSGALGAITQVRVWNSSNSAPAGIGKPADGPAPEGLDYDAWLGPAPTRPYNPNRSHFSWRYFWDYGGGKLSDFGCHIIDPVIWAINPGAPLAVSSHGGRYLIDDNAETPDTQNVVWEFAPPPGQSNPFLLIWSHTEANSHGLEGRGQGIKFCGSEGTLIMDYGSFQHYDRGGTLVQEHKGEEGALGAAGVAHKREFLDGIRARKRTSCDIEYAHRVTTLPLIGNIANRVGERLAWDAERERFVGSLRANRLLGREYRDKWSLAALGVKELMGKESSSTPHPGHQRRRYSSWGFGGR